MTERKSRIRVSVEELEQIKQAKEVVYDDRAEDRPHAEFLVDAAVAYAERNE